MSHLSNQLLHLLERDINDGPYSIDPTTYLDDLLSQAFPDLMRQMLQDRVNTRNGYRHRDFDTRVGTVDVAVPKLRTGSFSPTGYSNDAPEPNGP